MAYVAYIAVFVGIVVAVVAFGRLIGADRRRSRAFAAFAEGAGVRFDLHAGGVAEALERFVLFRLGHSRMARRLLVDASHGEELWVFDYHYMLAGGKTGAARMQTVAAFPRLDGLLPEFELRPRVRFGAVGRSPGYLDVEIGASPEFSSKYVLRGPDEHSIRRLFNAPLVEMILQRTRPICIESMGSALLVYRMKMTAAPATLSEFMDEARDVRKALRRGQKAVG